MSIPGRSNQVFRGGAHFFFVTVGTILPFIFLANCGPDESDHDRNKKIPEKQPIADRYQKNYYISTYFKDSFEGEKTFRYDSVRVRIHNTYDLEPSNPMRTTVELFSGNEKVHSFKQFDLRKFLAVEFRGVIYLFFEMWTGGGHCCFPVTIYSISASKVRHLKTIKLGNAYFDPDRDLFTRSNNLIYHIEDDRFAYYRVSFASSIFFDRFFKLKSDEVKEVNEQFRSHYLHEAKRHSYRFNQRIKKYSLDDYSVDDPSSLKARDVDFKWVPDLLRITVNYLMAGNSARAWDEFDTLYDKIKSKRPDWAKNVKREELKQDIQRKMHDIVK